MDAERLRTELGIESGKAGTAVILGSGLGGAVKGAEGARRVRYGEVDGLSSPSVAGHSGMIYAPRPGLVVFAGRSHVYEDGSSSAQEKLVRLAFALGCRRLLLTQAAGSLRRSLPPGSWMSATGVLSMPCRLPAGAARGRGEGRGQEPLISTPMRKRVAGAAAKAGVPLREGRLFWVPGPNYETPAESRMMEWAGADAVTMSPLPELLEARRLGIAAASLSWITNYAPSVSAGSAGHEGVVKMGSRGSRTLSPLLDSL